MKNSIKELMWADYLIDCIVSPRSFALRLANGRNTIYPAGFIFPVLYAFISILSMSLLKEQTGFFYYKISYLFIMHVMITLSSIVIYSSVVDLIFQFNGHAGNVKMLINFVNFSYFPRIFILPLLLFFNTINFAAPFWLIFMSIAFTFWSIYIIVRCISELHSINIFASLFIFVLPGFALFIVSRLSMVLFGFTFLGFLSYFY